MSEDTATLQKNIDALKIVFDYAVKTAELAARTTRKEFHRESIYLTIETLRKLPQLASALAFNANQLRTMSLAVAIISEECKENFDLPTEELVNHVLEKMSNVSR